MISTLWNKSSVFKPVDFLNSIVGIAGIGGKIAGESIGIFDKNQFTTSGGASKLSKED
jgi:hypothetical protein